MSYHELSVEERSDIQVGLLRSMSQRAIVRMLNRSPSTICREIRRNRSAQGLYFTQHAQRAMCERRLPCRPRRKLVFGNELFELAIHLLRKRFSPEQIADKLRDMEFPNFEDAYVCREIIYNAIYALPVGELRKELILCLRQGKTTRRPRSGGVDRRGQIPRQGQHPRASAGDRGSRDAQSLEGDLIKGNASAVGTLVERTSGYLMLVKMSDATATSAVQGFSAALNRIPLAARKSMTYDSGRAMTRQAEITQKTRVAIYFCDPHSPWQRGSNEKYQRTDPPVPAQGHRPAGI